MMRNPYVFNQPTTISAEELYELKLSQNGICRSKKYPQYRGDEFITAQIIQNGDEAWSVTRITNNSANSPRLTNTKVLILTSSIFFAGFAFALWLLNINDYSDVQNLHS